MGDIIHLKKKSCIKGDGYQKNLQNWKKDIVVGVLEVYIIPSEDQGRTSPV